MTTAPCCQHCDKPLRKHTTMAVVAEGEPYGGDGVVVSRRRSYGDRTTLGVWRGKYGYKGQGYFCSVGCGYKFAVAALRAAKRPNGNVALSTLKPETP